MDLLLLAQDVTWSGHSGDAIHLRELATHLARRGHSARVIARAGEGPAVAPSGVEVHLLTSTFNMAFGFIRRPLLLRAMFRVAKARQPTLVYSRGFGDFIEAIAAAVLGVPLVFEVNGNAIAEREAQRRSAFSRLGRALAAWSARVGFRRAAAVVTVTEALRKQLQQEFRVLPDKVTVVSNAADTDLFRPRNPLEARRELGLPATGPLILFVGNLAPWQGVEHLIRAFVELLPHYPDALLVIVGDGQDGPRLRSLVDALGLGPRVRFTGALPHDDVPAYVAAADVCVARLARDWLRSGSSALKVHEYLAGGRPVVASRVSGLEFLEAEGVGRLVPPEDPRPLAGTLLEILASDAWRREAGERARGIAVRRASWAAVAASVENVCRMAVGA